MILILGFHELIEGGEEILRHRGQGSAGVGDEIAKTRPGHPGRAGRLADRAVLALGRLGGRRLVGGRVPYVTAVTLLLAQGALDLVGDLVRHAARASAHQPALEIGDGVAGLPGLAAAASLAVGSRLGPAVPGPVAIARLATVSGLAIAVGFRHLTPPTLDRTRLPLQDEWCAGGAEMSHVQALRDADPGPAGQRLVHVPEDRVPGPGGLNRLQQGHAALLQAP